MNQQATSRGHQLARSATTQPQRHSHKTGGGGGSARTARTVVSARPGSVEVAAPYNGNYLQPGFKQTDLLFRPPEQKKPHRHEGSNNRYWVKSVLSPEGPIPSLPRPVSICLF